jgi:hypothetical protein
MPRRILGAVLGLWVGVSPLIAVASQPPVEPYDHMFDIHVIVVDSEREMPVWAMIVVMGAPVPPMEGTWATIQKQTAGPVVVKVFSPGFRPELRVMRPGLWIVKMVRIREV